MKVLILSPLPPPVGGIASWTVNVLQHYKNQDLIIIEHLNTAIKYRKITDTGFFSRLYSGCRGGVSLIFSLVNKLLTTKPDIIHFTSSGSLGLFRELVIVLISKLFSVSVVVHYRFGRISEIEKLNNWEWKLLKVVTSLCNATLVLDEESSVVLKANGFNFVYKIPNPISSEVESYLALNPLLKTNLPATKKKVIFVGHVVASKGVEELVAACSALSNIDELIFIGPVEEVMQGSLSRNSLQSDFILTFTGALNKENVLRGMSEATVLALPSYTEGFPNVIIEAMAMKCPVVATNVGAIPEMLDIGTENPSGIVVEPKDIEALSGAISSIITDQSLANDLKHNAFIKVNEKYTLKSVCSEYERVWHAILKSSNREE